MTDFIRNGLRWLATKQKEHMPRPVTYSRASAGSVDVIATLGRTKFLLAVNGQIQVEWGDRDYLIDAVDLQPLYGASGKPKKGDRILDVDGTYEVSSPGDEPCYRPSDDYGDRLRIHTKKIG